MEKYEGCLFYKVKYNQRRSKVQGHNQKIFCLFLSNQREKSSLQNFFYKEFSSDVVTLTSLSCNGIMITAIASTDRYFHNLFFQINIVVKSADNECYVLKPSRHCFLPLVDMLRRSSFVS